MKMKINARMPHSFLAVQDLLYGPIYNERPGQFKDKNGMVYLTIRILRWEVLYYRAVTLIDYNGKVAKQRMLKHILNIRRIQ